MPNLVLATIHQAFRSVRRAPGLALAAALCVGLGSAATAAVATLVSATLLRPVPFPTPDRLVRVWFEEPGVNPRVSLSIPEVSDFAAMRSFDSFVGTARLRVSARFEGGTERLRGEAVSRGYFELLGLRAGLGRLLGPADHEAQAPAVVVLSHDTWQRHYSGDPSVIGRTLRTQNAAYTIVGVTAAGFDGTVEDDVVELFLPIEQYEPRALRTNRQSRPSWVLGRLAPGASLASAQAEAEGIRQSLAETHPDVYRRFAARVEPFGESWRERLRGSGGLLFAAAALLLLIAAANVGCLLLARVLDRRRELAVRAALGAGRGRIAGQLFAEALLVVAAGGLLGAFVGPFVLDGFLAMAPPGHLSLPRYLRMAPDVRALAVASLVLAVAGLLAGTVPALLGRKVAPGDVLREGGRGPLGHGPARRWGAVLVAGETALTLVLLLCGGLVLRTYERLSRAETGFEREGLARLAVTLSPSDYGDRARLGAVHDRLRSALGVVPGIARVGLVSPTLPPWDGEVSRVHLEGVDLPQAPQGLRAGIHRIDAGLLPLLGSRILAGRNVDDADGAPDRSVAVISRSLAALFGGVERAVGRTVVLPPDEAGEPGGPFEVVGVASDIAYDGLVEEDTRRFVAAGPGADPSAARYDVYLSLARFPTTVVSLGALTEGDARPLIEPLRRAVARVAPSSAIHWVSTMDEELAAEYAPTRFYAVLVAAFSGSALALTGLGLFALLSHAAARRGPEMGLRLALGASGASAARLLLEGALRPILIGLAAGALAGLGLARAMSGMLYGVSPFDAATLAGAAGLLVAVALVASSLPARRVARIDPAAALRTE